MYAGGGERQAAGRHRGGPVGHGAGLAGQAAGQEPAGALAHQAVPACRRMCLCRGAAMPRSVIRWHSALANSRPERRDPFALNAPPNRRTTSQQTEMFELLQVSPWGARPLSPAQLRYAALDAHAAVLVRVCSSLLVQQKFTTPPQGTAAIHAAPFPCKHVKV